MLNSETALYAELAYMKALDLFAPRQQLEDADYNRIGFSERPSGSRIGYCSAHVDYSSYGRASELLGRLGISNDDRLAVELHDVRQTALAHRDLANAPSLHEMLSGWLGLIGEHAILPTTRKAFAFDHADYEPLLLCLNASGYLTRPEPGRWQWTDAATAAMVETYSWYDDGRSLEDEDWLKLQAAWNTMPAALKRKFYPTDTAEVMTLAVVVSETWDGERWSLDFDRIARRENRPISILKAKGMVQSMLREFATSGPASAVGDS